MNRTLLNLVIDLALAGIFLAMAATGYILAFALPPGTNKSTMLWTLTRHEWGTIHSWISVALITILLIHLALHWQWIISVIAKRIRESKSHPSQLKTGLIAVAVTVSLTLLFGWSAQRSVKPVSGSLPGICPPDDQLGSETTAALDANEQREVTVAFWSDIYPIFEKRCISCHGPNRQAGNFRADRREDFFRDVNPLILPGNSAESPLLDILSGKKKDIKLPERHRVDKQSFDAIQTWIDAGAEWPPKPSVPTN
jgi:hypothetical protein